MVLVLLSASVKRFSVSRMRDFFVSLLVVTCFTCLSHFQPVFLWLKKYISSPHVKSLVCHRANYSKQTFGLSTVCMFVCQGYLTFFFLDEIIFPMWKSRQYEGVKRLPDNQPKCSFPFLLRVIWSLVLWWKEKPGGVLCTLWTTIGWPWSMVMWCQG